MNARYELNECWIIPTMAFSYLADLALRDPKQPSSLSSVDRHFTNCLHLSKRQFVLPISFAKWASCFACHIRRILGRTAKPKVGGINAGWVISVGTIMKNPQTSWYRSKMENPTDPGSGHRFPVMAARHPTVSTSISVSRPNPTGIRESNLGKESVWCARRKSLRSQVLGSNLHRYYSLCPVGLLAHRAFSLSSDPPMIAI